MTVAIERLLEVAERDEAARARARELLALARHPAWLRLQNLVNQLCTISHIGGTSYDGKVAHGTDEDIGGRRPAGDDRDKPRRPREPRAPGEGAGSNQQRAYAVRYEEWLQDMAAYAGEYADWRASYQRRTPSYFEIEAARCGTVNRLLELVEEARATVEAWRKAPPLPAGIEPERGTYLWRCKVADDDRPLDRIKTVYGISRATVYRYRATYRGLQRQSVAATCYKVSHSH